MVLMRTDMTFPLTVKVVGLYIDQITDGRRTSLLSREVPTSSTTTESTVSLPSNLAIQNDGDASQVHVRVVAYGDGMVPIAMREARATVSSVRLDGMPLPMLWMNTGDVVSVTPGGDPMVALQSAACGAEQTLGDDGACVSIDTTLQPYEPTTSVEVAAGECNPSCFGRERVFQAGVRRRRRRGLQGGARPHRLVRRSGRPVRRGARRSRRHGEGRGRPCRSALQESRRGRSGRSGRRCILHETGPQRVLHRARRGQKRVGHPQDHAPGRASLGPAAERRLSQVGGRQDLPRHRGRGAWLQPQGSEPDPLRRRRGRLYDRHRLGPPQESARPQTRHASGRQRSVSRARAHVRSLQRAKISSP